MDILTEDLLNEEFETESILSFEGESELLPTENSPYLIGIFLLMFFFVTYTCLRNSFLRLFYVGGR